MKRLAYILFAIGVAAIFYAGSVEADKAIQLGLWIIIASAAGIVVLAFIAVLWDIWDRRHKINRNHPCYGCRNFRKIKGCCVCSEHEPEDEIDERN